MNVYHFRDGGGRIAPIDVVRQEEAPMDWHGAAQRQWVAGGRPAKGWTVNNRLPSKP